MRKTIAGFQNMCTPAYLVLLWSVCLSCAVLAAALVLLWIGTPLQPETYWLFVRADFLQQGVRALLFLAIFVSAFLEEHRT